MILVTTLFEKQILKEFGFSLVKS